MFSASLKLPLSIPEHQISALGAALDDIACAYAASLKKQGGKEVWYLKWILTKQPEAPDLASRLMLWRQMHGIEDFDMQSWAIEPIAEQDWLKQSYRQFPPFTVGPFFIYGSHYKEPVPDGLMGMQVDAATAFGSGEHGTTKGCLQAMLDVNGKGLCPWQALDMGTGSGILAIAAWKLWKTPILAVDNDPEAVRVAAHHRDINKIPGDKTGLFCALADGFAAQNVKERGPFELIIANILAGPLRDMAADLVSVLDENGYVILSGILNEQAAEVIAVYEAQNLSLKKRYDIGEWSTLVMHKGL